MQYACSPWAADMPPKACLDLKGCHSTAESVLEEGCWSEKTAPIEQHQPCRRSRSFERAADVTTVGRKEYARDMQHKEYASLGKAGHMA